MDRQTEPIEYDEEGLPVDCEECGNTGYVDYDMGGGNVRRGYCECMWGTERADYDQALGEWWRGGR